MKKKLEEYKNDKDYIVVDADEEDPAFVVKKFTDQDWDQLEDYLDEHPLFMKEFDIDKIDQNPLLSALQAIKYDEGAEQILEKLYVTFVSN